MLRVGVNLSLPSSKTINTIKKNKKKTLINCAGKTREPKTLIRGFTALMFLLFLFAS